MTQTKDFPSFEQKRSSPMSPALAGLLLGMILMGGLVAIHMLVQRALNPEEQPFEEPAYVEIVGIYREARATGAEPYRTIIVTEIGAEENVDIEPGNALKISASGEIPDIGYGEIWAHMHQSAWTEDWEIEQWGIQK